MRLIDLLIATEYWLSLVDKGGKNPGLQTLSGVKVLINGAPPEEEGATGVLSVGGPQVHLHAPCRADGGALLRFHPRPLSRGAGQGRAGEEAGGGQAVARGAARTH